MTRVNTSSQVLSQPVHLFVILSHPTLLHIYHKTDVLFLKDITIFSKLNYLFFQNELCNMLYWRSTYCYAEVEGDILFYKLVLLAFT